VDTLIHKFKRKNLTIVLDTNSNVFHIVNGLIEDIIDNSITDGKINVDFAREVLSDNYSEEELQEGIEEVKQLIEEGVLFSRAQKIDKRVFNYDNTPIKSICLHISHDCNMKCKYCFASQGAYHGQKTLMDFETGKKAIDFLLNESKNVKNLEVDFFGGEPLMNFETIKKIVEYARIEEKKLNKNIRFTITTNGVLLSDDKIDFINKEMSNVVLSLDGRKEINDNMRPLANDKGSYDLIVPKMKKLAKLRKHQQYYVRGTYTRNNLDFCNDVLSIADEGFEQISVEPVVMENESEFAIKESDLEQIFNEYDKLADELIQRKKDNKYFNFFHFMIDLDDGPCIYKKSKGCGSGSEYISITPGGDIYPCHQFADEKDFKLGDIDNGITNQGVRNKFLRSPVLENESCKECWAKYFCGGGCAANNYKLNKDISKPYQIGCELQKKRIECSLYIKAVEFLEKQMEG